MCSRIGYIYIDVNGKKGPNQWGRDYFEFVLSNEGKLYPVYGKDSALYNNLTELERNSYYWKNNGNGNLCDLTVNPNSYGWGCAARIIENGWKMDY